MATVPITLEIDAQLADAYRTAPVEVQRKMRGLITVWLRQLVRGPRRSLQAIMDDMAATAEANGLTPEELRAILNDREA
jgi:hypothetical protein